LVRKAAVLAEADRLIREFGDEAYEQAATSARLALKKRNLQMSAFHAAVAGEIACRRDRELFPGATAIWPLERRRAKPK
jgi:hypothetical protein